MHNVPMRFALKLAVARLRPFGVDTIIKLAVVGVLFGAFLWGDYAVFRRLFRVTAQIEALTPFFALGLIENLLGLVFLIALFVLFFSALTSAIGSFFADLDLDLYHAAPVSKTRILTGRWAKTFIQSSYLVVSFLLPVFFALAAQYERGALLILQATGSLVLLLAAPVSLASLAIILLVRFFPVRQVHQIAATLAIMAVTLAVIGLRLSRPERLFQDITTDDVTAVLQAIDLPSADLYPSTWLAEAVVGAAGGEGSSMPTLKLAALAIVCFGLFLGLANRLYFVAYVRAKETSAPVALGSGALTTLLDRVTAGFRPPVRAILGKELRILTRDAAQWSQMFMMVALLFLYLYNIRMLPLAGDFRAVFVAYLNLGMTGFVLAATCLRFAYPSISAEGRQFWIVESSPVSFRTLLWVKVLVYAIPLLGVGLLLTSLGNLILDAPGLVWVYTLTGAVLISVTLVALGVGMGAASPNFRLENPLELAMSIGGFAYMALSLLYVGFMMFLMARPMHGFMLKMWFGVSEPRPAVVAMMPVAIAIAVSLVLSVAPIELARARAARRQLL
jgi:ABC-2 type transport system permease protein